MPLNINLFYYTEAILNHGLFNLSSVNIVGLESF